MSYNSNFEFWFKLLLVGFILIFVGVVLLIISILGRVGEHEVTATGIILIGPIPIIWGFGPRVYEVTIIGLILLIIVLVAMFYFIRGLKR